MITNMQLFQSAQRALTPPDISKSIILIVACISRDTLQLDIIHQFELSNDEKDDCFALSGEILGDFPGLDDSKSVVNFFPIEHTINIRLTTNVIVYYNFLKLL